jgi:hypothetical protein
MYFGFGGCAYIVASDSFISEKPPKPLKLIMQKIKIENHIKG